MKKLSSDIAYYRQIGNAIILAGFFTLFITVAFKNSPTGQVIFASIGALLVALVISGLFRYKKVTYDSDTVFIKTYLTGKVIDVPLSNIVSIEKAQQYGSFNTMRSGLLTFSDGGQTQRIKFYLAYSLYSVVNLNNFIGVGIEPSPAFKAFNIPQAGTQMDRGKRLLSAVTDHFIMTMIIMVFAIPSLVYEFTHLVATKEFNIYTLSAGNWYVYVLDIGLALYFCKDCIRGQSPAKYIYKFQVVNNKTGEAAGPFRCFVRDIFILLWPIEAIILLINPSRRLGDKIAGTKVILADKETNHSKVNFVSLAIVLILAYPIMPVAAYLTDKLMGR